MANNRALRDAIGRSADFTDTLAQTLGFLADCAYERNLDEVGHIIEVARLATLDAGIMDRGDQHALAIVAEERDPEAPTH
jgi:hypothetical protein